jgi:hypothetical protein
MSFLEVTDLVSDTDRKYFEEHPEATEYTRPYIEGELPNLVPVVSGVCDNPMIRVVQIKPGIRKRVALFHTLEVVRVSRDYQGALEVKP